MENIQKDPLEEAAKKYLPFPKYAQEVQMLPTAYIIFDKESNKQYKIEIFEYIPDKPRGKGKKVEG